MTEKQFKNAVRSAGFIFILKYGAVVNDNMDYFNDVSSKHEFVSKIHAEDAPIDKTMKVTMNKLNALIRICQINQLERAYEIIQDSAVSSLKIREQALKILKENQARTKY